MQSQATSRASDIKTNFAFALLALASMPIKIYSLPGFEITPGLILFPLTFILFSRKIKFHLCILLFLVFCFLLAALGLSGTDGILRNFLGAVSYGSAVPYALLGFHLSSRIKTTAHFWRFLTPISIAVLLIFLVDIWKTGGNLMILSSYQSEAYNSAETTFIDSIFPFYGKYAVITLSTITMALGSFTLSAIESYQKKYIGMLILALANVLIFISFSMWTRQVMLGVVVFYLLLIALSFKSKLTWLSVGVFIITSLTWSFGGLLSSGQRIDNLSYKGGITTNIVGTEDFGNYKLNRAIKNIETGNIDDLSTGRMAIYREAVNKLDGRTFLAGCGFCNLKSVYNFEFSSLHNIFLTAIFKGGIFYAVLYCGFALLSLPILLRETAGFSRSTSIATVASLGLQGMVNDDLFFQVIPVLLFGLTGFLIGLNHLRNHRPAHINLEIHASQATILKSNNKACQ